jgi:hypothetical protein
LDAHKFDIAKWQSGFRRAMADMKAGRITSCMLVTTTVDGENISGEVQIDGLEESLSAGTDLAIQSMIDNGIMPLDEFDNFDDELIDFDGNEIEDYAGGVH